MRIRFSPGHDPNVRPLDLPQRPEYFRIRFAVERVQFEIADNSHDGRCRKPDGHSFAHGIFVWKEGAREGFVDDGGHGSIRVVALFEKTSTHQLYLQRSKELRIHYLGSAVS